MNKSRWILTLLLPLVTAPLGGCDDGAGEPHDGVATGALGPAPGYPGAGAEGVQSLFGEMICFFEGPKVIPDATVEHVIDVGHDGDALRVRLTFDPDFVDNTYGVHSIGWGKRGHRYQDLLASDHAELIFTNGDGDQVLRFKADYIAENAAAPSGYATNGVLGKDGEMIVGKPEHVLKLLTSLDQNLNERGYDAYIVDSPPTDELFSPSKEAPNWDYRVVYDMWIDQAAFGASGFGKVWLEYVHASPSKQDDTIFVTPGPCPPEWDPPPPEDNPPGEPPPESTPPATPEPAPNACADGAPACTSSCEPGFVCSNGCCIAELK